MFLRLPGNSRPSDEKRPFVSRFPEEFKSAYPRWGEYFLSLLPEFSPSVVANVLSDPKVRKGPVSQKIWHANAFPESFCTGASQIRLCGWLASTTEENIRRYAQFLWEPKSDKFSIESILNAKRLIIEEAKYRHIWIELPKSFAIWPDVRNPLLAKDLTEQIQVRTTHALDVRRRVDMFAKRLSRQCVHVTKENCRLVISENDLETSEVENLLRAFVAGHVAKRSEWDGTRIGFPHKPNGSYKDDGWAYLVALVRFLKGSPDWVGILQKMAEDLSVIRSEQPDNVEARSFARAISKTIRTELSANTGSLFVSEALPEPISELHQLVEHEQEVSPTAVEVILPPSEPLPSQPSLPIHRPFFKKRETVSPEPDTLAYRPYSASLPRTYLHPSRSRHEYYANLFNRAIELSSNGDRPIPMAALPAEEQKELSWMFLSHDVDLEAGWELIHGSSWIRIALDRIGGQSRIWAWSPKNNHEWKPWVDSSMF